MKDLTQDQMHSLLTEIRKIVDHSLRNGARDAAAGLMYITNVEELLDDAGIFEQNETHDACDGEGCFYCNFGRVRQPGDEENPLGYDDPKDATP